MENLIKTTGCVSLILVAAAQDAKAEPQSFRSDSHLSTVSLVDAYKFGTAGRRGTALGIHVSKTNPSVTIQERAYKSPIWHSL